MTIGLLLSSCREEPPVERHYPMRQPTHAASGVPVGQAPAPAEAGVVTEVPPIKRERPKPDPEIETLLEIISHSGRRFIDQAEDTDSRPTEYTAEQFASMLRSKWDWLGYDIVDPDLWLDEIATRSFKTTLPYLVVLDGATVEMRGWLDIERAKAKQP